MGALVGAAYASGLPIDTLQKVALDTDWKTTMELFVPSLSTSGLSDGKRVKKFLYKLYGDKKIEDTAIPFVVTASDIYTGKLYIINKGSLLEAVRASISVPIVFTPVKYKDILLVDGGLVDPVPIDVVREMGADYVIAVHVIHIMSIPNEKEYIEITNSDSVGKRQFTLEDISSKISKYINKDTIEMDEKKHSKQDRMPKIIEISKNTLRIAQDVIAQLQIELYKPDLVIEPDTRDINLYEFYDGNDAIKIGYKETIKVLNSIKTHSEDSTNK